MSVRIGFVVIAGLLLSWNGVDAAELSKDQRDQDAAAMERLLQEVGGDSSEDEDVIEGAVAEEPTPMEDEEPDAVRPDTSASVPDREESDDTENEASTGSIDESVAVSPDDGARLMEVPNPSVETQPANGGASPTTTQESGGSETGPEIGSRMGASAVPPTNIRDSDLYRSQRRLRDLAEGRAYLESVKANLEVAREISEFGPAALHALDGADAKTVVEELARHRQRLLDESDAESSESAAVPSARPSDESAEFSFSEEDIVWVDSSTVGLQGDWSPVMHVIREGESVEVGDDRVTLVSIERVRDGWLVTFRVNDDERHASIR